MYHLNLSGGVDNYELVLLGPHQLQHLVKLGGEQVEAGDDAAVRAQLVLFHYYRKNRSLIYDTRQVLIDCLMRSIIEQILIHRC